MEISHPRKKYSSFVNHFSRVSPSTSHISEEHHDPNIHGFFCAQQKYPCASVQVPGLKCKLSISSLKMLTLEIQSSCVRKDEHRAERAS